MLFGGGPDVTSDKERPPRGGITFQSVLIVLKGSVDVSMRNENGQREYWFHNEPFSSKRSGVVAIAHCQESVTMDKGCRKRTIALTRDKISRSFSAQEMRT